MLLIKLDLLTDATTEDGANKFGSESKKNLYSANNNKKMITEHATKT